MTLHAVEDHEQPSPSDALRTAAKALDALGVVLLQLAESADEPEADPMLTIEEAAAELRYSVSHVRAKCASGDIEALHDGGWRIRRSALQAYERRRTGR